MDTQENFRTRLLPLFGDAAIERLASACVCVFGCGGVGSSCIEALARGGIGTLVIVDGDVVSPSNINRQAIAFQSTIGYPKVQVIKDMVKDINPACRVIVRNVFVMANDLNRLYSELLGELSCPCDYLIDAIDTVSVKLALAELAQKRHIPLISSMGGAMKLHPECLRFADIADTTHCHLARIVRKECRKRGITQLKVLYSCERTASARTPEGSLRRERRAMGSASFMPPIMGQMIAGEVIRTLSGVQTAMARDIQPQASHTDKRGSS